MHALTHVIYPGYLLLLLFFYSKETGAVDGDHNFLYCCQQILLLFALAVGVERKIFYLI